MYRSVHPLHQQGTFGAATPILDAMLPPRRPRPTPSPLIPAAGQASHGAVCRRGRRLGGERRQQRADQQRHLPAAGVRPGGAPDRAPCGASDRDTCRWVPRLCTPHTLIRSEHPFRARGPLSLAWKECSDGCPALPPAWVTQRTAAVPASPPLLGGPPALRALLLLLASSRASLPFLRAWALREPGGPAGPEIRRRAAVRATL